MLVAIVGPAGSGKTTLTHALRPDTIISCDELVNRIYTQGDPTHPVIQYLLRVCPACTSHNTRVEIDKHALGTFLFNNPKIRRQLENLIRDTDVTVAILGAESLRKTVIVEGILPRFIQYFAFDYVLYVHTPEQERRRRLKQRGVMPKRIREIIRVQRDMFRSPFVENKT